MSKDSSLVLKNSMLISCISHKFRVGRTPGLSRNLSRFCFSHTKVRKQLIVASFQQRNIYIYIFFFNISQLKCFSSLGLVQPRKGGCIKRVQFHTRRIYLQQECYRLILYKNIIRENLQRFSIETEYVNGGMENDICLVLCHEKIKGLYLYLLCLIPEFKVTPIDACSPPNRHSEMRRESPI